MPLSTTGGLKLIVRVMSVMEKRLEKLMIWMLLFALRVEIIPRKLLMESDSLSLI